MLFIALALGLSSLVTAKPSVVSADVDVDIVYPAGMPSECIPYYTPPTTCPSVPSSLPSQPHGEPSGTHPSPPSKSPLAPVSAPTTPAGGSPSVPGGVPTIPASGSPSVPVGAPTTPAGGSSYVPISAPTTPAGGSSYVPISAPTTPAGGSPSVPASVSYTPSTTDSSTPLRSSSTHVGGHHATPTTTKTETYAPTATSISQCNTSGNAQCCNSVGKASDPSALSLLDLVGAILPEGDALVGMGCSPLIPIGGNVDCGQQPVCCTDNSYNGLVNIGCTPISL